MTAINSVTDLTIEDGIAVVTLDSPPVNALSVAVRDGIYQGVAQALDNDAVQAIVLICAGHTFIAGADITEFGKPPQRPAPARGAAEDRGSPQAGDRRHPRHGARRRPGGGAGLPLPRRRAVGEVRPAGGEARPAARRRRHPAAAAHRRRRKALEMMTSGDHVGAKDALAMGLVDELVAGRQPARRRHRLRPQGRRRRPAAVARCATSTTRWKPRAASRSSSPTSARPMPASSAASRRPRPTSAASRRR